MQATGLFGFGTENLSPSSHIPTTASHNATVTPGGFCLASLSLVWRNAGGMDYQTR